MSWVEGWRKSHIYKFSESSFSPLSYVSVELWHIKRNFFHMKAVTYDLFKTWFWFRSMVSVPAVLFLIPPLTSILFVPLISVRGWERRISYSSEAEFRPTQSRLYMELKHFAIRNVCYEREGQITGPYCLYLLAWLINNCCC